MTGSTQVRTRRDYPSPTLEADLTADSSAAEAERLTQAWIERSVPEAWRSAARAGDVATLYRLRPSKVYRDWYPELAASGLVAAGWRVRHGGLGLGAEAVRAVDGCLARFRLNKMGAIGLFVAAPTVLRWGSPELQDRLLPPIVWDDERWCQLFSEPGSGSDLASLATTARAEGRSWRVSGQKIWSSFAHEADFGILLTRTAPQNRKRKGITMFACAMANPGVEVRPLRQMTGESEFNEVFLDDVLIDDFFRLGPVNEGITVSATTLAGERAMISGAGAGGVRRAGGRSLEQLVRAARREVPDGRPAPWSDPVVRQRLMRLWCRQQTLTATNLRARVAHKHGSRGPDASIGKLLQSELNQDLQEAWFDLFGSDAVGFAADDVEAADRLRGMLRSRANTLEGGTSEIQRTVIGERVLGLPREPDPYLHSPWSEIPRS